MRASIGRPLDLERQVGHPHVEQLLVGERRPVGRELGHAGFIIPRRPDGAIEVREPSRTSRPA